MNNLKENPLYKEISLQASLCDVLQSHIIDLVKDGPEENKEDIKMLDKRLVKERLKLREITQKFYIKEN
jgi:hypothetical protein